MIRAVTDNGAYERIAAIWAIWGTRVHLRADGVPRVGERALRGWNEPYKSHETGFSTQGREGPCEGGRTLTREGWSLQWFIDFTGPHEIQLREMIGVLM